jgi:hypothetical protein
MAEEIFNKAKALLRSMPQKATFTGGVGGGMATSAVRQTADIIIDGVGFSTKFSSDAMIGVMETTFTQMFSMLGGEDPSSFEEDLDQYTEKEQLVAFVVNEFATLAQELISKPTHLNYFINSLLAGHNPTGTIHKTYPAFRNYVTNSTAVGFSPALMADFDSHGSKLAVKEGAAIDVQRTRTTVNIRIKKESSRGTKVQIEIKPEGVIVKMTNLVGQR